MTSPGARDELERALEAAAAHTTDDEDDNLERTRYVGAEGTPSRAASSDGDPEERLEALKDGLDVFVDPGERDGLPSARRGKPEETSTKAAWGLVRGLTQAGQLGSSGVRRRKTGPGGFTSGQGLNREESKEEVEEGENKEEERSGFGAFISRIKEGNVQDLPAQPPPPASSVGGGGILSALIALQQQQQNGTDSTTASGATTPTSMGPSTRTNSIAEGADFSDEDEEEAERSRFLAKLHEKRANKNRIHHFADGLTQGAAGVGVGVGRGAGAVIGTAGRGAGAVIGTAGKGAGAALNFAGKATGFSSKPGSKSASGAQTPAVAGEAADARKKDNKSVFDRAVGGLKGAGNAVGLEFGERPDAARSGAGVFGGLIAGTVRLSLSSFPLRPFRLPSPLQANITGIASPHASSVTTDPTRPGYHISRYSQGGNVGRSRSASVEQSPEIGRSSVSTVGGNSQPGTPVFGKDELPTTPGKEHRRNVFSLNLGNLSALVRGVPSPFFPIETDSSFLVSLLANSPTAWQLAS
jgi:hypothetical protein